MGTGAWVQDEPRIVSVRYDTPVSALLSGGEPLVPHQHLLDGSGILDAWGEGLDPAEPGPTLETSQSTRGAWSPARSSAARASRSPVPRWSSSGPARCTFLVAGCVERTVLDHLGEVTTGADGSFYFDFVETPHWDPVVSPRFLLRATVPAGDDPVLEPEEVQEVGATIPATQTGPPDARQYRASRARHDPWARDLRGRPHAGAAGSVQAASTLFDESKTLQLAADGSFTAPGMPVGPITLSVKDGSRHVGYATVGIDEPGAAVEAHRRGARASSSARARSRARSPRARAES